MTLQTGDKCPSFTLPDQDGEPFSIDEVIGRKLLVIYFYPKDETGGCTAEACSFRDSYADFTEMGCEVVGISADSVASHERFAAKHSLNFRLLADTRKEVYKLFGVNGSLFGLLPARVTFIIDKTGTVRSVHDSLSDPKGHVTAAKQAIGMLSKSTL